MGYIEQSVIEGEEIRYLGNISPWALSPWIVLGVAGLAVYGLGIVLLLYAYIVYWSTELAVTNKRVISKRGLLSRHTVEIGLGKVESVEVEQSLLGRMFGFGTIFISGTGTHQAEIPSISDPMAFRRAFMSALDTHQD